MHINLASETYLKKINDYFLRDMERLENTAYFSKIDDAFSKNLFTSFPLPIKISFPLFEPRAPYATASSYFQPMLVDGEKQPIKFSGDSTRSISIHDGNLIVISKSVAKKEAKEYLQSYYLLKFSPKEFTVSKTPNSIQFRASCKKKVKNIITGQEEEKEFAFSFNHKDISHSIIDKKMGVSTKVREVHGEKIAQVLTSDLENYLISVPHFNPHPYLLDCYAELGYPSRRDMQVKAWEYFL